MRTRFGRPIIETHDDDMRIALAEAIAILDNVAVSLIDRAQQAVTHLWERMRYYHKRNAVKENFDEVFELFSDKLTQTDAEVIEKAIRAARAAIANIKQQRLHGSFPYLQNRQGHKQREEFESVGRAALHAKLFSLNNCIYFFLEDEHGNPHPDRFEFIEKVETIGVYRVRRSPRW